ncbi:MAG: glycine oxidase ThiO [bacterium]
MKSSDILILGGGIIGMSIARELAGNGLNVRILERHQPGREASWASAGMLAPQGELSEGAFQKLCIESNRRYPAYRADVEEETGIKCYHREAGTMALAVTDEDEAEFRRTYQLQKNDGLEVEWITGDEARSKEPELSQLVRGGMYLPGDRHVENRLLVPALEKACRIRGVDIVNGAQVIKINSDNGKASGVSTIIGDYTANIIINTAGAWSATIDVPDETLRPPVFPVRGQMMAIELPTPTFLNHVIRSPRSYMVPRHDNRLFLGATMEEVGFNKSNSVWGIHKLLSGAKELLPNLDKCTIIETWAGLRPGSADNHPILGYTSLAGYIMATGMFRNGLLLTPVISQTIAELIISGSTPDIIALFNINRFADGKYKAGKVPGA